MDELRVGMVGYAFMGRAHSQGWATVNRFFDLPLTVRRTAICGRDADAVGAARSRLGWESAETDWRRLVERPDIDLVDICAPGSSHAEIAIAALEAGKHVLCEKPLANTVAEAEAMASAAAKAVAGGALAMVAFNYRRVPALELARQLIASGRLGDVRHVRAVYLQDWIVDPDFPLVWRLVGEQAGSGALGDIGAHSLDLAQHLLGDRIVAVSALSETFVRSRPLPGEQAGLAATATAGRGDVTVDDATLILARFGRGAISTFEATRFATGRRNGMRIEVNGSQGSVCFDLERLNELEFFDNSDESREQGWRRILVTQPDHPWMQAWWPPGHVIGWEHTFSNQFSDLVTAIHDGEQPRPSFADGLALQRVLDAVGRSATSGRWTEVAE